MKCGANRKTAKDNVCGLIFSNFSQLRDGAARYCLPVSSLIPTESRTMMHDFAHQDLPHGRHGVEEPRAWPGHAADERSRRRWLRIRRDRGCQESESQGRNPERIARAGRRRFRGDPRRIRSIRRATQQAIAILVQQQQWVWLRRNESDGISSPVSISPFG